MSQIFNSEVIQLCLVLMRERSRLDDLRDILELLYEKLRKFEKTNQKYKRKLNLLNLVTM